MTYTIGHYTSRRYVVHVTANDEATICGKPINHLLRPGTLGSWEYSSMPTPTCTRCSKGI